MLSRHLEHVTVVGPAEPLDLPTLAELLDTIPDPRSHQGRRYRLGPLPALSLLAVLGGATSLAKIAQFIAGYNPDLRARAGLPGTTRLAASTLGRLFARLDGGAFDTATCTYLAALAACTPLSPGLVDSAVEPFELGQQVIARGSAYKRRRAEDGGRGQREAPPITIDALRAMVAACDLATPIGRRDRLLLVLGLALMGRRSELVALTRDDVREVADGLEVTIRTSKTDKDSAGETIAIPRGSHPLTDPVTAWRDWLHVLDQAGHSAGRLLRRINRHGHLGPSLGADAVNTIVRDLAVRARVPYADTVTAHSLRAGGATVAYAAGVPVAVIAKHGRWAPASPVVLRYIRAVDRWRDNAMRNVGL